MATTIARTCLNITRVLTLPVLLATNNIYIFIYIYIHICVCGVCVLMGDIYLKLALCPFLFFFFLPFLVLTSFNLLIVGVEG